VGTLQKKIQDAWALRSERNIEACLTIFVELKRSLDMPLGKVQPTRVAEYLEEEGGFLAEKIEVLLLSGAIGRAQMNIGFSNEVISAIESTLRNIDAPVPMRLYMEKGLNLFSVGDYSNAIELFIASSQLSSNLHESIQSELNILLCLENLNLSSEKTEQKLKHLFKQTDSNELSEFRGVLDAFYLRKYFRNGSLDKVFRRRVRVETGFIKFYRLWIKQLPYHCFFDGSDFSKSIISSGLPLHQGAYRTRTLLNIVHPDDQHVLRPGEHAFRVYMWTWRWLTSDIGESPIRKALFWGKAMMCPLFWILRKLLFNISCRYVIMILIFPKGCGCN